MQAAGDNEGRASSQPPATKCYKWLEEIDTDVLRTCPADTIPGSNEIPPSTTRIAVHGGPTDDSVDDGIGTGGKGVAGTEALAGGASPPSSTGLVPKRAEAKGEKEEGVVGEASSVDGGLVAEELTEDPMETVTSSGSVSGGGTRNKLRRVLRAFAVHNRRVSYCQV